MQMQFNLFYKIYLSQKIAKKTAQVTTEKNRAHWH